MTLRKLGSRSTQDLKVDQSLKSFIRFELKDLINDSVQDYLQRNRVPVATINIKVDRDCSQHPGLSPRDPPRGVRLNISTSSIDAVAEPKNTDQRNDDILKQEENLHWMAWRTFERKDAADRPRKEVVHRGLTPSPGHRYRCASPFQRPRTAIGHSTEDSARREASFRHRPLSIEGSERPRTGYVDRAVTTRRPTTSVAVGPDRHFEDKAMNTRRSYQVSDYLKKNMDLTDPYERNVYSSLMEVMRKKNQQAWGTDSVVGDSDPIVQVSEYKHRFQNPRSKPAFPTSSSQSLVTVRKPPACPHKTRTLGVLRPPTPVTSKTPYGEQFLF